MNDETGKLTHKFAASEVSGERSRKRNSRKPVKSGVLKKIKVTYYLSAAAIERVGITATMEHIDKSEVVERLIHAHLRQWVVSFRGQRVEQEDDGEGTATEASLAG